MGSFSTCSVRGENDVLTDAGQVDLRFDAYFGEYFWVINARKLKHLCSQKCFYAARDDRFSHSRLRTDNPPSHELYFFPPSSTNSTSDVTTSPVISPHPPRSTAWARRRPRGGSYARLLVEILLQNWSTAWGNLDTSGESLCQARRHPRCVSLQSRSER
jgi:hypothetical protein